MTSDEADGARGWWIINERVKGGGTDLEVDQEGGLVGGRRSVRLETILGVDIIHPATPIAKVFLGNECNVGSRRVLDYYGKRLTALDVICFSSLSVVEEIGR